MTEHDDPESWPRARHFSLAEGWTLIPDPLRPGKDAPQPESDLIEEAYAVWTVVGAEIGTNAIGVPINIELYIRGDLSDPEHWTKTSAETHPEFLVHVQGNTGKPLYVYAAGFPDAMRLLAEWMPVGQAAALVHLVAAVPLVDKHWVKLDLAALLGTPAAEAAGTIAEKFDGLGRTLERIERTAVNATGAIERMGSA